MSKHRHLFLTVISPISPLKISSLTQLIRIEMLKANIQSPKLGSHCFRHCFVSRMIKQGGGLSNTSRIPSAIASFNQHLSIQKSILILLAKWVWSCRRFKMKTIKFTCVLAEELERFVEFKMSCNLDYYSRSKLLRSFDRFLVLHKFNDKILSKQICHNYIGTLNHLSRPALSELRASLLIQPMAFSPVMVCSM